MEKYNNQLKTANFNIEEVEKKKGKKTTKDKICNDIFTFDIETTSAFIEEGKVIPYRKGCTDEYWNSLESIALCYIWQFSYNNKVYYGRELTDFIKVLDDLPKDSKIIIWVHNLSFEFHFLQNILTWVDVFARTPHKPMKAICKEYKNIEFRCSYILSGLSLDSWGKQIGTNKKVGQLDYDIIRTPFTPLTDKEIEYCEYDCLVVYEGIKNISKNYFNIHDIPLTATGIVRRIVKDLLTVDDSYMKKVTRLIPQNAKEYKMLQCVFAGGYTHANNYYAGKVVKGKIDHYDFTSSYPTSMLAYKYPATPWAYTGSHDIPDFNSFDEWAYIIDLTFYDIESKSFNTYIQASKCTGSGFEFDNGRIIKAKVINITITEQDYITIFNNYEWKKVVVNKLYKSKKEYLHRDFLNYLLDLYAYKTSYKDVPGYEDLYMNSKKNLNSTFGMYVTNIINADVVFESDNWYMKILTSIDVNKKLGDMQKYNYRNKKYFLSYSVGCWICAYSRRNLWKCIETCDSDMLYCDTDSIFVRGDYDFTWYNEYITELLKKSCEVNNLDFEKTRPKTPKGKIKPLGIFDKEEGVIEFLTLGAKRYVERRTDGKLYLTVSGINKEAVALLEDDITNFKDGFIFDKDSKYVTKKLSNYLDNIPTITYPDGYISTYKYGINLRRSGYTLTMTDEYKLLIKYCNYDVGEISDTIINHLRGRWKDD